MERTVKSPAKAGNIPQDKIQNAVKTTKKQASKHTPDPSNVAPRSAVASDISEEEAEIKRNNEMLQIQKFLRTAQGVLNSLNRNSPCPCKSGKKFKKCCLVMNSNRRFIG